MDPISLRVEIPVIPLIAVLMAAVIAALIEFGLHYYFHPNRRPALDKIRAYAYGSLGWVTPLLVVFAILGDGRSVLITVAVLAAAGASTWAVNRHDRIEDNAHRAEDSERLLTEAEHLLSGGAYDPHERRTGE